MNALEIEVEDDFEIEDQRSLQKQQQKMKLIRNEYDSKKIAQDKTPKKN